MTVPTDHNVNPRHCCGDFHILFQTNVRQRDDFINAHTLHRGDICFQCFNLINENNIFAWAGCIHSIHRKGRNNTDFLTADFQNNVVLYTIFQQCFCG